MLANVEYTVEGTSTGKAQLKDGVFEEPAAPGSAAKFRVQLGKEQTLGDVNGDGLEDAAVTLLVTPGGSGSFTYLAVVVNDKGAASPSPAVLLGDRIIVKSVAIKPGTVTVILLTRKPEEPMIAAPTVVVRVRPLECRAERRIGRNYRAVPNQLDPGRPARGRERHRVGLGTRTRRTDRSAVAGIGRRAARHGDRRSDRSDRQAAQQPGVSPHRLHPHSYRPDDRRRPLKLCGRTPP